MTIKLQYISHLLLHSKIKVFLPLLICIICSLLHNDLSNISLCEEVKNNNENNSKLIGMGLFVGSIIFVFFLQYIHPTIDPSNLGDAISTMADASTYVTPDMLNINPEVPLKSNSANGFFIKTPEEFQKMLGIIAKNRESSWIRLDVYEQLLESELADADAEKLNLQKSLYWAFEYQKYLHSMCPKGQYLNKFVDWLEQKEPQGYMDLFGPIGGGDPEID